MTAATEAVAIGRRSRYELYRPVEASVRAGWRLDTVLQGADLFGANGMSIANDSTLWITEFAGNQITRWDPATGIFNLAVPMDGPIATPDDLVFDRDGVAYVTTMYAGEVWTVAPDGATKCVVRNLPANNGIAVTRSNRVFVDQMMAGGALVEIHPSGGAPRVVASDLSFPNAFAEGPDGRLYLQELRTGCVAAFDPESGRSTPVADGFEAPTSVRFDAAGRLVVTEAASGVVTSTVLETGERSVIARGERGLDNCCFDAAGRLYVSNYASGGVTRFLAGATDAERAVARPGLVAPCGLAAWDDGAVLVADYMGVVSVGFDGVRRQLTILQDHKPFSDQPSSVPFTPFVTGIAGVGEGHYIVANHAGGLYEMNVASGLLSNLGYPDGGAEAVGGGEGCALVALGNGTIVEMIAADQIRRTHRKPVERASALVGDGTMIVVCDERAGELAIATGDSVTMLRDIGTPVAVAIAGGVIVVATADGRIVSLRTDGSGRTLLASGLPFGLPLACDKAGIERRPSLLARQDGSIIIGCDGDGSLRHLFCVEAVA